MGFMEHFNEKNDNLINTLKTIADGKTSITLVDWMSRVSLDIIAKVFFY